MTRHRLIVVLLFVSGGWLGVLPGRLPAQSPPKPALTLLETDDEEIDIALEDKQPGAATQDVYLPSNPTVATIGSNSFQRNPGLWTGPKVDLSAISAYSDKGDAYGTKFAITAISPLHCLGAAHCGAGIGTHYNFVGADNVTVMRTVVASLNPVDDIEVYLLNQPLPPRVTPMRILPRNWYDYLPVNKVLDLPAIFINQHNRLYLAEAQGVTPGADPLVVYHLPAGSLRQQFNTQIISGDSSFPEMVLVHNVPAILSLWHYAGYGSGPLEAAHYDAINAAMKKLSQKFGSPDTYQLRPINLQGIAKMQ